MNVKLKNIYIGDNEKIFIIAEIGVNHNGDVNLAKKMIKEAAKAGAGAVKFQTFIAEDMLTKDTKKAKYQEKNSKGSSQIEMIKELELSEDDFFELSQYAEEKNVLFLSSPFDTKSVDLLDKLDISGFKIGSGELNNFELIEHIESKGKPIIISTGMSTLEEIQETFDFINNKDKLIILHCITGYPSNYEDANLKFISTLKREFKVPIGFSDHSPGIELAIASVGLGVCLIEKHFTLDKTLPGPDQGASLNPNEFKAMVDAIRNVEIGMGTGERTLCESELEIKKVARKSIVANVDIPKDSILNSHMLTIKRPGTGIEPKHLKSLLGRKTKVDIKKDDLIEYDFLI
ncbi:MAG: N-acetylneuraminate synthase [Methanobrevibacter sp.]|nr:N-acetylneuraminate synthase [Methanobrevibacter sp.]